MMHRLLMAGLLVTIAACRADNSTGLTPTAVINVRVRDDTGAPVDRTHVIVTMSTDRFDSHTNRNGAANIAVSAGGLYAVRIVPRDGYVGAAAPTVKSVNVEANGAASVDFTVNRAGRSTDEPVTPTTGYQVISRY